MGEFSASDCSWKKMVLMKEDNGWTASTKTDQDNPGSSANTDYDVRQMPFQLVKRENDDANAYNYDNSEETINMIQELDPLLVETKQVRKRRGSASKNESPEERQARLAKMSAYAAQRLANETPEQRATRLRRMSQYAAKRLSQETSEQRAKRLARMSAYAAKRLASETPEQRQARLTRMSAYAAKRQAMKKSAISERVTRLNAEKYQNMPESDQS